MGNLVLPMAAAVGWKVPGDRAGGNAGAPARAARRRHRRRVRGTRAGADRRDGTGARGDLAAGGGRGGGAAGRALTRYGPERTAAGSAAAGVSGCPVPAARLP